MNFTLRSRHASNYLAAPLVALLLLPLLGNAQTAFSNRVIKPGYQTDSARRALRRGGCGGAQGDWKMPQSCPSGDRFL